MDSYETRIKAALLKRLEEDDALDQDEEAEEEEGEEEEEAEEEEEDFSKLNVAQLKSELKARGLSTSGKKTDLLARLQESGGDAMGQL